MEIVPFLGWERNAKIVSGDAELIVTLEIGPRILHYGPVGGPNLFFVNEADAGSVGDSAYRFYGGHRLWIGPEEPEKTMQPENGPVEYTIEGETHVFASKADKFHIRKTIRITPIDQNGFRVEHVVHNDGAYSAEFAAWSLSMCATGTVAFPQAPFEAHTDRLLPTRPIVLWGYTKLGDPRWTWGNRVVRLRQDSTMGPQKVGTFVEQGYAAAEIHGHLLLKRFQVVPGASHADLGCNFETFTNQQFIEIETLGPLTSVAPGGHTSHTETWYLVPNQTLAVDDDACADQLADLISTRPA
jgi:hypothetical protein